jgi:hypothetical protein
MVIQYAPERAIVWGYGDGFNVSTILTINKKISRRKSCSSFINILDESIWSVTLDDESSEAPFQVEVNQPSGTFID